MGMAFIAGALIGGLIGAALVYVYNIKQIKGMKARLDRLEESFDNAAKKYMRAVYRRLVMLRDSGIDGLDDLIGSLGRLLDYYKENKNAD